LSGLTASSRDAQKQTRSLSVAIVDVATDRKIEVRRPSFLGVGGGTEQRSRPIEIDLANAQTGGVLVIANQPVLWSAVNVRSEQRAKIAVEGNAVFDLENASNGLLAGFRIGAFGKDNATSPTDVERTATRQSRRQFCQSVVDWARHFQIDTGDIRMWRFTDPDRISVQGDRIASTGGTMSTPQFVSEYCR
jgi:hypothetical protein